MQNPNRSQNPKSKIQTSAFGAATKRMDTTTIQKSKIQDPKSKTQNPGSKIQNPRSKIQNPKSKIQNPKSKIQTAGLDFGFGVWIWSGRAGAGGDGYVAVWARWPPEFGVVGGGQSL